MDQESPSYLSFRGPCQLAYDYVELPNQGVRQHAQGYSTPVGLVSGQSRDLSEFSDSELKNIDLYLGKRARLLFKSGVLVEGLLKNWVRKDGKLLLMTWEDCRVTQGDKTLFDPSWGVYDMAIGCQVTSVFGGPADRSHFGELDDFANRRVPTRQPTIAEKDRYAFFSETRALRDSDIKTPARWQVLADKYLNSEELPWLCGIELLEIAALIKLSKEQQNPLLEKLKKESALSPENKICIREGLRLAGITA